MTRIRVQPKAEPLSIIDFRGEREQQGLTDLPFNYAKKMVNCRITKEGNIQQRDGTIPLFSHDGGLLAPITGLEVVNIQEDKFTQLFDVRGIIDIDQVIVKNVSDDSVTTYTVGNLSGPDYSLKYVPDVEIGVEYSINGLFEVITSEFDDSNFYFQVRKMDDTLLATFNSGVGYTFTPTESTFQLWLISPAVPPGFPVEPTEVKWYNITLQTGNDKNTLDLPFGLNSKPALLYGEGTNLKKIYTDDFIDLDSESVAETVGTGLENRKLDIVQFQNIAAIFNGGEYHVYENGASAKAVATIPVIYTHTSPAGVGTEFGEFNVLTSQFAIEYDGDGATTSYKIPFTNLDGTLDLELTVDDVTVVENVGFTYTIATSTINFAAGSSPHGPPSSNLNNVVVKPYILNGSFRNAIDRCKFGIVYSGANDVRLFCSGNALRPNVVYWSALNDPLNFPITNSSILGDITAVTGFVKQHNDLIVSKIKSIFKKEYQEIDGIVVFTQKTLNSAKGTPSINQLYLVNNDPLFVDKSGVQRLYVSDINSERNVTMISDDINFTLLQADTSKAVCFDYEENQEFFICIDGTVWIYNYNKEVWYTYSNVHADYFFVVNGELFYSDSREKEIFRFDPEALNDYEGVGLSFKSFQEQAIHSYWEADFYAFGREDLYKNLDTFILSVRRTINCRIDVKFRTEEFEELDVEFNPLFSTLDLGDVDFGSFSFETAYSPHPEVIPVGINRFIYIKVILENDYSNSTMNVVSMKFNYSLGSRVR